MHTLHICAQHGVHPHTRVHSLGYTHLRTCMCTAQHVHKTPNPDMKWVGLHGHRQPGLCWLRSRLQLSQFQAPAKPLCLFLVFAATVEEMSPLHTPVASAFPAGGEDWAADPSPGHFGEVSPEEPKEPRPVVSPGPVYPRAVLTQVLTRSCWCGISAQAQGEEWQVLVRRHACLFLGGWPGARMGLCMFGTV